MVSKHDRKVTVDCFKSRLAAEEEPAHQIYSQGLYLDIKSPLGLRRPNVWQYREPRGTVLPSHDLHLANFTGNG